MEHASFDMSSTLQLVAARSVAQPGCRQCSGTTGTLTHGPRRLSLRRQQVWRAVKCQQESVLEQQQAHTSATAIEYGFPQSPRVAVPEHRSSPGESALEKEAWDLLREAIVSYCGEPVGTIAANDPTDPHPLNYDQVFIRDFIPSAIAFLLKGETEIVRNFLLHTLQLQVPLVLLLCSRII